MTRWTPEEDRILVDCRQAGKQWRHIVKAVPGRTYHSVRLRGRALERLARNPKPQPTPKGRPAGSNFADRGPAIDGAHEHDAWKKMVRQGSALLLAGIERYFTNGGRA